MKNNYEIRGETTAIFINRKNGDVEETLIDTALLPLMNDYPNTWKISYGTTNYIGMHLPRNGKERKYVRLHRIIVNAQENEIIDHINHNTFDNRLCNLRSVTKSQNCQNRSGAQKNSKTGVRGVYPRGNKFKAQIKTKGKTIHLGTFDNLEDAKKMVLDARKEYFPFSVEE